MITTLRVQHKSPKPLYHRRVLSSVRYPDYPRIRIDIAPKLVPFLLGRLHLDSDAVERLPRGVGYPSGWLRWHVHNQQHTDPVGQRPAQRPRYVLHGSGDAEKKAVLSILRSKAHEDLSSSSF